MKVKIIKEMNIAELDGEKVMIDFNSGKYFMLRGSANDIWDMLEDGVEEDIITERLLQQYNVDEVTCRDSVTQFLASLVEKKIIALVD